MTELIPFPALTTSALVVAIAPCPRIFLWITPTTGKAYGIVANDVKMFLTSGTATFIKGPADLPNKESRNPPD